MIVYDAYDVRWWSLTMNDCQHSPKTRQTVPWRDLKATTTILTSEAGDLPHLPPTLPLNTSTMSGDWRSYNDETSDDDDEEYWRGYDQGYSDAEKYYTNDNSEASDFEDDKEEEDKEEEQEDKEDKEEDKDKEESKDSDGSLKGMSFHFHFHCSTNDNNDYDSDDSDFDPEEDLSPRYDSQGRKVN